MSLDKVLGVLVLYNCKLEDSESIVTLNSSLEWINQRLLLYVYDNSLIRQYPDNKFEYGNFRINYVHDNSNPGVSKAYNMGAKFANETNRTWLLLLDQDTLFQKDFFQVVSIALIENKGFDLYATKLYVNQTIISPSRYYFKRGFSYNKEIVSGSFPLRNTTFLNSGLIVSLQSFIDCGGYSETVKLYFSDFVFIDRLRKNVKKYFLLNTFGQHQLSSNDESDYDAFLVRFELYLEGALCAGGNNWDRFQYFIGTMLRTFKQVYRHKTLSFLKLWFNYFILRRKL